MATKKIAQTVITEDKFYTIAAANGKVVEVKDYNTENGAQIQLWDNANAECARRRGRVPHQEPFHRQDDGPGLLRRDRWHPCSPVGRR